jgi:hypothetical protein
LYSFTESDTCRDYKKISGYITLFVPCSTLVSLREDRDCTAPRPSTGEADRNKQIRPSLISCQM